jgi:hypothetical protein
MAKYSSKYWKNLIQSRLTATLRNVFAEIQGSDLKLAGIKRI